MTASSMPVRSERSCTAGCVPFPDAARLIWTRSITRKSRVISRYGAGPGSTAGEASIGLDQGRLVPFLECTRRCEGADQGVSTDLGLALGQREMALLGSPSAVRGKDNMDKAQLVSRVAAETSTTRAAAEPMVGAVFSAILRRARTGRTGEPVAVPASKVPSFKLAKALRAADIE